MAKRIAVAGATGNLGQRIVKALLAQRAEVVALARNSDADNTNALKAFGAEVTQVELSNMEELSKILMGTSCIVSALQGLRDVIVDSQTNLLKAAVKAGVPRFIPSDFSSEFTKRPVGENRNFDLRREFHQVLEQAPIAYTSIYNGAFSDILSYNVPLFDSKKKVVGYWDDPDWRVDFTTMDDAAAYTAAAAMDADTPKALRIASFQASARELQKFTAEAYGVPYELKRLGSVEDLAAQNRRDRAAHPEGEKDLYANWQQGQYLQSMFSTHHESLDNARYPSLKWKKLEEVVKPGK